MVVDPRAKEKEEKEASEQQKANSLAMKSFVSPNSSFMSITTKSDMGTSLNMENIFVNKFDVMFEKARKKREAIEWAKKAKILFERLYHNRPRYELGVKQTGNLISDFAYYRHDTGK